MKENDLVHGEFGKWLEDVEMNHRQANRFMKVYEEIPNSATWSKLSSRALYEIATLPEEERKKEHTTSKGETPQQRVDVLFNADELIKSIYEKGESIRKENAKASVDKREGRFSSTEEKRKPHNSVKEINFILIASMW